MGGTREADGTSTENQPMSPCGFSQSDFPPRDLVLTWVKLFCVNADYFRVVRQSPRHRDRTHLRSADYSSGHPAPSLGESGLHKAMLPPVDRLASICDESGPRAMCQGSQHTPHVRYRPGQA